MTTRGVSWLSALINFWESGLGKMQPLNVYIFLQELSPFFQVLFPRFLWIKVNTVKLEYCSRECFIPGILDKKIL